MKLKKIINVFAAFLLCLAAGAQSNNSLIVSEQTVANAFPLFASTSATTIVVDTKDATVVTIAAKALANDIQLVSGKQMQIVNQAPLAGFTIIAGTIGKSKLVDELINTKQLDVSAIKNKWECFVIKTIGKDKLVIAGSDRRGTAFGIFHLSRLIGVSPFVWWADVTPVKKKQLYLSGSYVSKEPSVQYRGIFINDEDWGLQPWAAKNMDTDIKDIGPKTYAKVFELLLRLKANYIWPAMHPCTKAFYYYKNNPRVADDYAIVVGGSHCEPMLRNNVFEWAENYEREYGKKPGEWRYDLNKEQIYRYWDDRVKEAVNYESVYTVGMRGVHDGSMPGPKDPNEKLKLLETIISDQRSILATRLNKPAPKVPQIFVPYKEVLSLYRRGLALDDDVTIIWPDDNHGYIRQLPNEIEQKRNGGHGVYYHLSYWGSPADYLWLSSVSPALIGYEMKKAYDYNAKKLWVFNAGDIKPAELEIQFALDMAWDISNYDMFNPSNYIRKWTIENFGIRAADQITKIKEQYYELAQSGKPEHLNLLKFTAKEIDQRLRRYDELQYMVDACSKLIDSTLTNAYFQLVKYPVEAAVLQNRKILAQQLALQLLKENNVVEARSSQQMAQISYEVIQEITNRYNRFIAGGKWNGIMSWKPRDQKAFAAPLAFDSLKTTTDSALLKKKTKEAQLVQVVTAKQIYDSKSSSNSVLLPNIGINGAGVMAKANTTGSAINYKAKLNAGTYDIVVKCLPTFGMETGGALNYAVSLGNDAPQTVNVNAEAESAQWKENVLRGFSAGETKHILGKTGITTILIEIQNKNLVISQIEIYKVD
ncbi:MAG TPA: glycosyl hydrolase 115 family protein [Chitinophagaceae bacterium]